MDLAQRITIVSIIVTTTWGLLEILGWRAFGSVAFLAAGVDALFDTGTSLGVIAGLRISRRKADFGHPYGHYQAETLVSMALGAVLIFVALHVIFSAAERLRAAVFKAPTEAFLIALLSMPTFGTLAMKKIRIGKRTGNMSVVADGYHTLSDFFSSLAVFVGFVLTRVGYPQADPLVAFGISALIMWYGVSLLRKTANILMEASPSDAIMTEIKQITRKVPGVIDCHKCRARRVGSKIFADLHITVKADTRVDDAHKIATLVERRLKRKIKGLQSVIVHVEPHG